uniref:Bromodomain and PHD finger-containing protein 3 n=1 Tax=Cajanus cajan TaxID=3821 RepID=A0A151RZ24_CAJCA|nr:Bromodomain and PHD finger-containing protein 3 [Cajanus cajan]
MGEVSETMTKRKKKGRPSLLDLQKRSLRKQQRQNPNSQPNTNVDHDHDHDDDDDERKEKKHKLLVGLNSHLHHPTLLPNFHPFNSDPKRRRIDPLHQTDEKVPKATDSKHGSQGESGPTTPLPDKKLLLFILDRLQKKDTHGVFSEPVDPEELPDYHDIIKQPMDFGTVRKKLDGGLYADLEQFEKDVFLICSNAMQYNSADTIYHRQARAMQEIARKDFENLRQDSDDSEPQPKIVQRGRPPGKQTRKSLGMPPSERVGPESSSDATLASGGDIASGSNGYNLRKVPSKFQPTDSSARVYNSTFNSGGYAGWSDWENEFPASVVKAVLRYGKKQFVVDETRRDTYKNPMTSGNERPVLTTVEDEFKQLLAVGVHMKHSYARSLANFAADLGPVVWKIAASKISSVLPTGHEFGPGWVSEDDVSQMQHLPVCDEGRTSDPPVPEDYRSRFSSPSGSFPLANRSSCLQSGDMVMNNNQNELNPVISIGDGSETTTPVRIQQESMAHSDDFSSHDRLGSNFSSQMKMVRLADLTGSPSTGGVVPQMFDMDPIGSRIAHTNGLDVPTKQNSFALANDLNGKIGTTNSPSSNVEAGSQLQPNLALQL